MHIDTHKAFNKLVNAGLQKEAAETIIWVIEESRKYDLDNLATKEDVRNLEFKIVGVHAELKQEINDNKLELKQDIATLKQELSDVKSEIKQDIASVRLEVANVRTELKEEIVVVKSELKQEITEVKIHLSKVAENVSMIKWLCVGIFIPIIAASVKVLFSTVFGQ